MPSISTLTPATFDSGRSVTLSGSGFGASQGKVLIAGQEQPILFWSDTSITFTTARGSQSLGNCRVDIAAGPNVTPVNINATLTVSGWGQEVSAGGSLTGPAPLAVFFDATTTTADGYEPFREAGYHFDFGYPTPSTPGTWTYSEKPKGNQVGGPVTAHVYETPGTYVASVRAQLPDGTRQDRFVTIVVQDTDTYWTTSGRTTVTLTRSAVTTWPAWVNNTRYLLEAGQDYSALGAISIKDGQNILIARTGVGPNPVVSQVRFAYTTGTTPPIGARVVFSQLDCRGSIDARSGGVDGLFYKCLGQDVRPGSLMRYCYTQNPSVSWARPRRIFYWECSFDGENTGMPLCDQMYQFAMVGCSSTNPVEHGCRIQGAQYAFIGHNWFHSQGQTGSWQTGNASKHALTIRGNGLQNISADMYSADTVTPASRYIVAADNLLSDGSETNSSWPLYIGPQATTAVESLEYVIAERIIYTPIVLGWAGQPTHGAFRLCRQVTIRDDIYRDIAVTAGTGLGGTTGANPPEWVGPFYSNTFISAPNNITSFYTPSAILPNKAGT